MRVYCNALCGMNHRRRARVRTQPYSTNSLHATSILRPSALGHVNFIVPLSEPLVDILNRSIPHPCPLQCASSHHALRQYYVTASAVAPIIGVGPGHLNQCARAYITGVQRFQTLPMRRGQQMELPIAQRFCEETGIIAVRSPPLTVHKTIPWLAASFDMVSVQGGIPIELKYMYSRTPTDTQVCPPYYWIQLQIQMEVADRDMAYFCEYREARGQQEEYFAIFTVERDRAWFAAVYERIQEFWKAVQSARQAVRRTMRPVYPGSGQ